MTSPLPKSNCTLCPRLAEYRVVLNKLNPTGHNAPVPCFGDEKAKLLIVGQAPGWDGANRTGRPFTGDKSGESLYNALLESGFAKGSYGANKNDSIELKECMITNAVRCAPYKDKKYTDAHLLLPEEVNQCRQFLKARIETQKKKGLKAILALGLEPYKSILTAEGIAYKNLKMSELFLQKTTIGDIDLYASYHPSPRTRQWMSPDDFVNQFKKIKADLLIA